MDLFRKYNGKRLLLLLMIVVAAGFLINRSTGTKNIAVTNDTAVQNKLVVQTVAEPVDTPVIKSQDTMIRVAQAPMVFEKQVKTGSVSPQVLVDFARTLIGVPYVYASSNPNVGFDCSGFITYVFNHFNIAVPRSSVDFSNVGRTVSVEEARKGDLILFTGTNAMETAVGHMGLVVSNNLPEGLQFIHSSSGKAMGVTVSGMTEQYKKRFVRVGRIF